MSNYSVQHINKLNKTLIESFEVYDKVKKNYDRNYENYNRMIGDLKRLEDNLSKQKDKVSAMEKILGENLIDFYKAEAEYKQHHFNYSEATKQVRKDIIESKIKDLTSKIDELKFEMDKL
jgi:hypothetical protein